MEEGQIVDILNGTIGGKEILEGHAKLIKRLDNIESQDLGYEFWEVEFDDQPGDYFQRRVVNQ